MGATICRLDGEGCAYPQESCFCQCEGSPCVYWSYWRLGGEGWTYSNLGAGNATVRAGDVDGWRWGEGSVDRAEAPPSLTFADICVDDKEERTAESAEVAEENSGRSVTPGAAVTADTLPTADQSGVSATAANQTSVASQASGSIEPVTVLAVVIGLAVVVPLAALTIALLRRRGGGNRA